MSDTADDVAGRLEKLLGRYDAFNGDESNTTFYVMLAQVAHEARLAASLIRSQAARIKNLEGALQSIRRLVGDDANEQHEWTAQDMVEALQGADQTARAALERT